MSERDFCPTLLPLSAQHQSDIEAQWLGNLTIDELVSHAELWHVTPLERVLAGHLADNTAPAECDCDQQPLEEEEVYDPHWPMGLDKDEAYVLPCDDKGRNGGSWLRVVIANDGDVHLVMQDWEDPTEGQPSPVPTLRCRTLQGGGHHTRTHQALLWLARAIQLDNEDIEANR